MSLEVFFDNTQIGADYITGLTTNAEMFNESFKLGQTVSTAYTLVVAKEAITTQPTQVTLKDNGSVFTILEIDEIKEDDYTYTYTLTDKMVDLEFNYDASEIFNDGSATLLAIAQDICDKVGLTLYTQDFRGYDKSISWYDNTRTAREYIGYIAELNGGYARIDNGQLKFIKQKQNSVKTISIEDCADFIIGEYHKISRVVYEVGTLKYEFGNEDNNTLYLNGENVFITTEAEVEGIYNDVKNFEFYSFTTTNCPIDFNVKVGETITFTDGIKNYPTIANYSLDYFGDWYGGYSLEVNTERQEETKLSGVKQKIKNLSVKVDRNENLIAQVVEETEEQKQKLTQTKQTVDELTQTVSENVSNINELNNTVTTIDETVASTSLRLNEFEVSFEEKTRTLDDDLKENVETVKGMSYKFTTDELKIAKVDDIVNTKINNTGMRVYSYEELKAIFNHKGSGIQDLIVVGDSQIGNLKIVKAVDENGDACTDFHHLVSNIQTLQDLEV